MAVFILPRGGKHLAILVNASTLEYEGGLIIAYEGSQMKAIFRSSEIIGCWLDTLDNIERSLHEITR